VPADKVDDARLDLAGAGLPKTGRIGFELFDKTNLGVTDFGEKVNYRRALEGELERSIKTITSIETARVHITFPKDSVFLDSREPAKASVLVKLRPGASLEPQNVVAISNLVGSAVEGLSPDAVSVVDMRGTLLRRRKWKGRSSRCSGKGVFAWEFRPIAIFRPVSRRTRRMTRRAQ
jgi:flagellar M-ring protein FliF